MSFVLRSHQFMKTVSSLSRRINLTSNYQTTFPVLSSCCNTFDNLNSTSQFKLYSTNVEPIEQSIRRLDNGVKRAGRVSLNEIKNVISELNTRSATSTQALMIIKCCGNLLPEEIPENRTQLVQTIWKSLEALGTPLDISHYNALLRVYLDNEHKFSPTEFLSELESKSIEPNRVTFQRLISRYCQDGDLVGATKILEFMRDKSFPITEGVFNALIFGHSQANDMHSAEGILGLMKQANLEPSADTYTTLLCGYAKQGDIESIKRILGLCEASLVNTDFLEIIFALAVNGQHQYIEEIISKIQPSFGYSSDAANFVYRLVSKGEVDTAYRIVKTLSRSSSISGEQVPSGGFLIKHMVKTGQPFDKVKEICERLKSENLHPYADNVLTQTAIEVGDLNSVINLLKDHQAEGHEIRIHYFWPIICRTAKQEKIEEVLKVLKAIESEFGMYINAETVRDYILPHVEKPGEITDVFNHLRGVGIPIGTLTCAYMTHFLSDKNIKQAAKVAKSFRAMYPKSFVRSTLVPAYLESRDLKSLVAIVRAVCDNSDRPGEEKKPKETEFSGNILIDILKSTKQQDGAIEHFQQVLNAFVDASLSISAPASQFIQNIIQENMTQGISEALCKLTSEELESEYSSPNYSPNFISKDTGSVLNAEVMAQNIKKLESNGENAAGLKRNLLNHYIREQNYEKAVEYFNELESDSSFDVQPGFYALMIDLAVDKNNVDGALNYLSSLNKKYPNVKIDNFKTIKLATCLLNNDKETEMIDLLKNNAKTGEENLPLTVNSNMYAWRLLNTSAEKANPEKTKNLFELLRTASYIEPNNVVLGALIKSHILKDDYNGAIEQFEDCVKQYRATPWKGELTRHFIAKEDAVSLQRITDLSTTVHGEINSLYDLMFCFLECGRLRQARKILETPGMKLRQDRLASMLVKYTQEGALDRIENLLKVTQDIPSLDRDAIYLQLLDFYIEANDVDKGYGLWTQMQENDEAPSDQFLYNLAELLKKNNKDIPFAVPKSPKTDNTKTSSSESQPREYSKRVKTSASADGQLRNMLAANNTVEAMRLYESFRDTINIAPKMKLISTLIENQKVQDANKVISELTTAQIDSIKKQSIIKNVLYVMSVEQLHLLEPKLTDEMKVRLAFAAFYIKALSAEGKIKPYLDSIGQELEKVNTVETILPIAKKITIGGIIGLLEDNPELLPELKELCIKFGEKGFINPISALFNYYIMNGLTDEANNVFEKYLLKSERSFKYSYIFDKIQKTKDYSLGETLLKQIKRLNDMKILSHVYSMLIKTSLNTSAIDKAVSYLERAIEDNATEMIIKKTVEELQAAASAQGKPIPLELINKVSFAEKLPSKLVNSSSSSSSDSSSDSSDDEIEQDKKIEKK